LSYILIGNLNLSRSLGDLDYKQNKKLPAKDQMITAYPECKVVDLSPDCDFIILACDGIWDCLTNQEICDIVKEKLKKDPNVKLSKVIEDILDSILATDIHNGNYLIYYLINFLNKCRNLYF
jgi:serine/threonine protein phosphatase PrpC